MQYLENIVCTDKTKSIESRLKIVQCLSHVALGRKDYCLQTIISLGHLIIIEGEVKGGVEDHVTRHVITNFLLVAHFQESG